MTTVEIITTTISGIALLFSIASFIVSVYQNKKLHNENIVLQTKPSIKLELLVDSRIGGQIVKKQYAIDSFNVWESAYTPFYIQQELVLGKKIKPLFTICITNNGNAVANSIVVRKIALFASDEIKTYESNEILFSSCGINEKLASRIYIDCDQNIIEEVEVVLEYRTILQKQVTETFRLKMPSTNTASLVLLTKH